MVAHYGITLHRQGKRLLGEIHASVKVQPAQAAVTGAPGKTLIPGVTGVDTFIPAFGSPDGKAFDPCESSRN